jgi:SAM-dependent methyltransferase
LARNHSRQGKHKKQRKNKKDGKSKSRAAIAKMARGADRHRLYEESVQEVESDVQMMERVFKKRYGRAPTRMREDFCGTAALCCEWVRAHADNRAVGVDIEPEVLEYGRQNHFPKLDSDQRSRVELRLGDVLEDQTTGFDVTCAFNFSYFCFQTRELLTRYFKMAHKSLETEGLFIIDLYGGADAQRTMTETREQEGFDYVWDQYVFDPVTHHVINYIHFEFPDGSEMRRAFTYDWRLWSIPELRDLLADAGFSETQVYWEGTDRKTNEPNGVYRKVESAPDDPAWVSYIVAYR